MLNTYEDPFTRASRLYDAVKKRMEERLVSNLLGRADVYSVNEDLPKVTDADCKAHDERLEAVRLALEATL